MVTGSVLAEAQDGGPLLRSMALMSAKYSSGLFGPPALGVVGLDALPWVSKSGAPGFPLRLSPSPPKASLTLASSAAEVSCQ